MFKVNNKDTRKTPMASLVVLGLFLDSQDTGNILMALLNIVIQ